MTASAPLPDPRDAVRAPGAVERIPLPPAGTTPSRDATPRSVEMITAPPLLFAERSAPSASQEEAVDDPVGSWQLVIEGGRTFQLIRPRVLLGRDPVAQSGEQEIVVLDPTRTVSKTHALLELVDDSWLVTDLGSLNGVTLVQPDGTGRVLAPGISHPVSTRFCLGGVVIALRN